MYLMTWLAEWDGGCSFVYVSVDDRKYGMFRLNSIASKQKDEEVKKLFCWKPFKIVSEYR